MKIIKQGVVKVNKEFTCKSCECEFVATHDEYKPLPYFGTPNEFMSKCPCCGETVTRYEHELQNNQMLKVELTDNMISVLKMDDEANNTQDVFVIEEMSELIKELTKEKRQHNQCDVNNINIQHDTVFEKICDVLCTVLIMCYQRGYKTEAIAQQINYKCERALTKYQ